MTPTQESLRLEAARDNVAPWRKWGPYLSERQWGTVREDYSSSGDAWSFISHDLSRSAAYRWGEDGLAGISDEHQILCFAIALWNGVDPILKERAFGLTNPEGNHGEDVKEYYFYLDSTPTHSYMKYLYKYPQRPFPYTDLVVTNRERSRSEWEYELLDTGVFAESRYFDIQVEYAKADPDDILVRITVSNRGPEPATLHVLPTIWFRNVWQDEPTPDTPHLVPAGAQGAAVHAVHSHLGDRYLYCDAKVPVLFTDNESNPARVPGARTTASYFKDGINDAIVTGRTEAVNPQQRGSKAAAHYRIDVPAGGEHTIRLRLCTQPPNRAAAGHGDLGQGFEEVIAERRREADEFYASIIPQSLSADEQHVMRQALAGMLWTKQYYSFDLDRWIEGHDGRPSRNAEWAHMVNESIISMPDKWEYPWYAAWDLAFHAIPLALVDTDFAKHQLELLLDERYQHPNGQVPAYEWNFSDVNPPVHAWAARYVYDIEKEARGKRDTRFLERVFQKLTINFTWWVNRKDRAGQNLFEGGFLGLDNIGVIDRSQPLPGGGYLDQADGTAWMAFFCHNMLDIAMELTLEDAVYEPLAYKFFEHFFWIADAMAHQGDDHDGLWDEEDGFFYDIVRMPDGQSQRLKVRSLVGLMPLCAATVIEPKMLDRLPGLADRLSHFLQRHPDVEGLVALMPPRAHGRRLLTVLDEAKLRRVLERMLDENEFLSPFGVRGLSRAHLAHPYRLADSSVGYEPAESQSSMFGGNSNWRGPIWFPMNTLILRALMQYHMYFGDDFRIECPTGSGRLMTLGEIAVELNRRLRSIFLRDASGRRPVYAGIETFQTDPHWRDHILFYEYFHGDNGAGLGASHQTGWTGLVARMSQLGALLTPDELLKRGREVSATSGAAVPSGR